jgi:AraC-like DNA-binding protein
MPEFQASHFFILKILQCRIFTAVLIGIANLFRNYLSPYSYIEIATYLGFSSQIHLEKVLKKYTGMTMRQYRKKYERNFG